MSMKMETFLNLSREEEKSYLDYLDSAYYDKNESVVTDKEYDAYRRKYIELYGERSLDYVPGSVSNIFKKYKHKVPVISLGKFQETESDKIKLYSNKLFPIVIEPKYDGLTVVAYPIKNGKVLYVTRGSGIEGEILPNFMERYEDIDFKSEYPIRGEVLLSYENFLKIKKIQRDAGEKQFKQIRNAASGILRSKERSKFIEYLSFICYDVIGLDVSEKEKLSYIKSHTPFDTTAYEEVPSIDRVIEQMHDMFNSYGRIIPLDGMVVKTLQNNSLQKYGVTNHHPKNSFAVKWNESAVRTVLRDVHWQLGKTGALTPVADFDPVEILGSTVSQASLSNPEEIKRLDLHIGDDIAVIKAKEIIPKIVMSYGGGEKEIDIPTKCPSCGSLLHQNGPVLYCENNYCREILAQKLAFMASKKALDIPGLSIETCRQMVNYPQFEDICLGDLLWTDKEDYMHLDGIKDKKAQKLSDGMKRAMNEPHPFRNWLSALCFDGIGYGVADALIARFGTVKEIENALFDRADKEEIEAIPGIGKVTAEALLSQKFHEDWTWFKENFPVQEIEVKLGKTLPFTDKSFALTGKMPQPRSYYEKLIKENGGTVVSSVSKNTTYLVIADTNSTSSKAEKARKLGTKLIAPNELIEMTQSN